MRVPKEEVADDLPPARPARSRKPAAADAEHQEAVRQRRESEAAEVIGSRHDETSTRVQLRRAQRARMQPQPAGSNPRRVGSNAVLTASADAIAAEESMLHHAGDTTADQVQCEDAVPEETADTQGI